LAGAAVYMLMINVTLAHLEAVSGMVPFDMRPLGYDPQVAARLLDALGAAGRNDYITRQIPLDTVYPALLAMTLFSTIAWLKPDLQFRKTGRVGIACAIGAALFDYAENLGIAAMILNWPNVADGLVYATSGASIAKSGLTTGAVVITLALGAIRMARFARERHQSRLSSLARKS
jgi:hypothetical protein